MPLNGLEHFRGCCQIAYPDGVGMEFCAGYADLPNRIPNGMNTRFATASAGKAFVAVAVLKLIEKGLLSLDARLGDVVPMDWRAIDPGITVEQLLTHTSGIPDYFDESVMTEYEELWRDLPSYRMRANDDLLPLFIDKPMMYKPGARFQYNNTGYVVLAMMLERVSGQPFDAYLQTAVFAPCGMSDTGYFELDRLPDRCAAHYIFDELRGKYRTNIFSVEAKGTGAGGAYTTVGDIERFWRALMENRLLSEAATRSALSRHSGDATGSDYGYGFWLHKTKEGAYTPYFQGCDPGVSFISAYFPSCRAVATAVSNYGDDVWAVMDAIRETMPDK